MDLIPEEIEAHYQLGEESERLSNDWGELERLRTQTILARHLPPPPAVILDIGGAAGAYAFPLAKQGYEVHLIDPVPLHLEQAESYASNSGIALASIVQGDARQIDFPQSRADAVLLLGPLYHLVERSHRLRALREVRRVLKSGGVLFAASLLRRNVAEHVSLLLIGSSHASLDAPCAASLQTSQFFSSLLEIGPP